MPEDLAANQPPPEDPIASQQQPEAQLATEPQPETPPTTQPPPENPTATNSKTNQSRKTLDQFSADNADHNIRTLTGKGTFHGMGIIKISTNKTSKHRAIKRLKYHRYCRSNKLFSPDDVTVSPP